ncbi:hypothetical protein EDB86DRAFT_2213353 [Lactarius hatsudake]|nr:hypothetical protein EDB86DRAFT_2213353 [Lactarius hatsudake]
MSQSLQSSVTLGATPPLAGPGPTSPPISSILPLLSSAFTTGLSAISYISGFFRTISYSLFSPLLVIVPVGYYLLSPIIISAQLIFDTFVGMPYRAAVYVLQAVYPIYAFLGVACLSGVIIGLGGTSDCEFGRVGIAWGGGPIDSAERFSPANTTAEEVVDFPGEKEGHCEGRGLNPTEFFDVN